MYWPLLKDGVFQVWMRSDSFAKESNLLLTVTVHLSKEQMNSKCWAKKCVFTVSFVIHAYSGCSTFLLSLFFIVAKMFALPVGQAQTVLYILYYLHYLGFSWSNGHRFHIGTGFGTIFLRPLGENLVFK